MRKPRFLALPRPRVSPEAFVVCLAATVEPGQAAGLTSAVVARAAKAGPRAGTVVLALAGAVDVGLVEALCSLQEELRSLGTCLRLVVVPQGPRQQLREQAASAPGTSLAIHPSVRSAVLAAYAARLGPGVVTAEVRATLSAPAEPVHLPPRAATGEQDARQEVVRGPG